MERQHICRALHTATRLIVSCAVVASAVAQEATTRVSVDSTGLEGNFGGEAPVISADGETVAFLSWADNLVASDTNGVADVFVHDRSTGVTERVSVDSSGVEGSGNYFDSGIPPTPPSISADGQVVAFSSYATNLVVGDRNNCMDVFVHDRSTGITERVSVSSSGAEGDWDSYNASISADGQIVAFESFARNLVAGDTNGIRDVFIHDRSTGITERVSVDSSGAERNNVSSSFYPLLGPRISADGQLVVFTCDSSNLVAGDTNGTWDVFVHDRSTGITERVSVDSSGAEGDEASFDASISADGQAVAFQSRADNLVSRDSNDRQDVFVHERATGITERVSVDSSGVEADGEADWEGVAPSLSADGAIVTFSSWAYDLVAGDTNGTPDVFVHDRSTGETTVVSTGCGILGDSFSVLPSISADGTLVAFESTADNLVVGDTNGSDDVFVHDRTIVDGPDASWSNYGAGYPGTLGEPSLTARNDPVLGTTLTIDLANSLGKWTVGFLMAGQSRESLPTNLGGTLLVGDLVLFLPLPLPITGAFLDADIPADPAICGFVLDAQAIELDPGASKGVSFTPGIELLFGH
jgi:hypothetical protein